MKRKCSGKAKRELIGRSNSRYRKERRHEKRKGEERQEWMTKVGELGRKRWRGGEGRAGARQIKRGEYE